MSRKKLVLALVILAGLTIAWVFYPRDPFAQFMSAKNKLPQASKNFTLDINNDSRGENYDLAKGRVTIREDGGVTWQSPTEWWIDDIAVADSTNDGTLDINLSVWKSGNYGPSKPFWVEENDNSVRNHFFVMAYREGTVKAVWQSSNLTVPNCAFKVVPVNEEKNSLVVIEGEYSEDFSCQGKHLAVWQWSDWGFGNEWRSSPGNYTEIDLSLIPKEF